MTTITLPRAVVEQALKALEEINKLSIGENAICLPAEIDGAMDALRAALAQEQDEPLTIERLRDALVASRIIPPAAVEDPDEYDDGVTLHRIEALHRRLT